MASEDSASRRVRSRQDSDATSPDVAAADGEVADPRSAGAQEAAGRRRVRRRLDPSAAAGGRAQVGAPKDDGDHAARSSDVAAGSKLEDAMCTEAEEDAMCTEAEEDAITEVEEFLGQLPTDLLLLIMEKIEAPDLIKCASTCKSLLKMMVSKDFRVEFRQLRSRSDYVGMHGSKGEFFYQHIKSSIPRGLTLDFIYHLTGHKGFTIADSKDGKLLCHLRTRQTMDWYVVDPLNQTYDHLGRSPKTGQYFLRGIYIPSEGLHFSILLVILEGGPNSTRVKLQRYLSGTRAWSSTRIQTGFQMPPQELPRQPNVQVGHIIYILQYSNRVIGINLSGRSFIAELKPPEFPSEDTDCIHSLARTAAKELSFVAVGFSRTIHVWAHKQGISEKMSAWAPQIIRFSSRLTILGSGTRSNTILLQGYYSDGTHRVILLDTEEKKQIPVSQDRVRLLQPTVYELECPPVSGMRRP